MKNIKLLFSVLSVSFFFSSIITAQHGDTQNRRVGNIDVNQIKTVFTNYGVIAQPGNAGPRLAWKYDPNGYAGDMSILLGLELPIRDYRIGVNPPDGIPDTIHSVIITPVDRPGGGEGGGGRSFTFEPLPGYFNPNLDEIGKGVAMSHLPETWPTLWLDHPEYGTGVWNGLYGPDNFVGDQEAYFVMDDFNDTENFDNNDFYPDSTDHSITGHGIEIKVRYVEISNPTYQDILFKIYDIKNCSHHNYPKVVFGNLIGTYIGAETPEWNDDVSLYYPKDNLIVSSDFDNFITPSANPNWQGPVGMFGESFLFTPTTNKIASFQNFVPAGGIAMSDDIDMWNRMLPGFYQYPSSVFYQDSIPYPIRGEDGDYLWGGNYFPLNSMETKRIVTASVFGYNKSEILLKMKYAEALYNSNFDTTAVKNSITLTSLNYHKVVSGNETITWDAINSNGTVEIWYSADGGNNWKTIIKNFPNNDSYNWNTTQFDDGAFAKLLVMLKNDSGFIYAIDESEYFTVNNSGNGAPFVKILNDELQPDITITDEEYNFNLLVGDPENDPLLLKVLYSINQDTVFRVSQNINISSDTSIQVVPISLKTIPNSDILRIKFEVTDGIKSYFDVTAEFRKQTQRQMLLTQNFEWIRRYSEVPVEIRVIDSTLFSSEEYIISFSDTVPNALKTFSVFNLTTNQYTLLNEPFYPNNESLIFDGMTLYTEDIETQLDQVSSRWNNPHPLNLDFVMTQFAFASAGIYGHKDPFDYIFSFSNQYNDSSNYLSQIFGSNAPPARNNINFKVFQMKDNTKERIQFAFTESNNFRKDSLSYLDQVTFSNPDGTELSWKVLFPGDFSSNVPAGGDTLFLFTKKGLSVYDTIRVHGLTVDVNEQPKIPMEYLLSQNYPNPFNPTTKITYSVASLSNVVLKVYDILGREVVTLVNEEKPVGKYEVNFNASNLASGVYIYKIQAGSFTASKKLMLLK